MNIDEIRKAKGVTAKASGKRGRKAKPITFKPKASDKVIAFETALMGGKTPETPHNGNADVVIGVTKAAAMAKAGVGENGRERNDGVLTA